MKKIEIKSITEYFAKKRILQQALLYFKKNPEEETVYIESTHKEGRYKSKIICKQVYKQDLIKALGYDFVKEYQRLQNGENFYHKNDFVRVYKALRKTGYLERNSLRKLYK